MKTLALLVVILLTAAFVSSADAQITIINIERPGFYAAYRIYQPAVLRWRTLVVTTEGDCTIFRFFTASGIDGQAHQFLGEEIFCNGQKIRDTYREND